MTPTIQRAALPLAPLATLLLAFSTASQESVLSEPLPVTRVVDGDTVYVQRDGGTEKLRLLSVDTEEKITGRPAISPTKPETVYGQESADWAKRFFADLGTRDEPAKVRLLFPTRDEQRDIYGRLLCHVILMDGRDFNVLLVEQGRSPYFNKYGNSLLKHAEFEAAQKRARAKKLGVWNPATNEPKTEGAPAAKRPYDRLLPWWQARADAIDNFRKFEAAGTAISADDPDALAASLRDHPEAEVRVFGEIHRLYREKDGTLTAEFRSGDRKRALRAVIGMSARAEIEPWLQATKEVFRQNFVFAEGRLEKGPRGLYIVAAYRDQWKLGGPEPKALMEAGASGVK
ncbi:MAG: hypothetical protein CMJ89_10150 [Planctomycetes bacterium]|jgi:micrococcal nuclease|nr:hypothetical protein [Planctomycetota bacterium]